VFLVRQNYEGFKEPSLYILKQNSNSLKNKVTIVTYFIEKRVKIIKNYIFDS